MYHINPDTGATGHCAAKISCRFKLLENEHYSSEQEAKAASEKISIEKNSDFLDSQKKTKDFKKAIKNKTFAYEGYDETLEQLKEIIANTKLKDDEVLLLSGQHKKVRKELMTSGEIKGNNDNSMYTDSHIKDIYDEIKATTGEKGLFFSFKVDENTIDEIYEDYEDIYFSPEEAEVYLLKINKKDILHTAYHHEFADAIGGHTTLDAMTQTTIDSEFGSGEDLQVIIPSIKEENIMGIIKTE